MAKTVLIAFLGNTKFDARSQNMAQSLFKNGFNVILVDELDSKNGNLINENLIQHHVDTKFNSGIKRYWNYHCRVQEMSKKYCPDIFIAGDLFSLAVCSKQKEDCLKIFDSREIYSKLASLVKKPIKQFFWSIYEQYFYKNMDQIIVTAQIDKKFLISKYGEKKIDIIHNFPKIQENVNYINIRNKYNIPKNSKIFIYQGAIQIGRGIEEMISLLTIFKNCVGLIVGDGEYKPQIDHIVKNKKLENRVFFTGSVPYSELISLTKQSNIGFSIIQPLSKSYEQALPNKIFEYGLAGIPSIGSDFPEMKKYLEKFNLGIAVNPQNKEEHTNAVTKLLEFDESEKLISTVKENLTWYSQEKNFLSLMEND